MAGQEVPVVLKAFLVEIPVLFLVEPRLFLLRAVVVAAHIRPLLGLLAGPEAEVGITVRQVVAPQGKATLEELQLLVMVEAVAVLAQLVWLALLLVPTVGQVFLRISRALALLTLVVEVVLRHRVALQEA
jgi:hypothetical protein